MNDPLTQKFSQDLGEGFYLANFYTNNKWPKPKLAYTVKYGFQELQTIHSSFKFEIVSQYFVTLGRILKYWYTYLACLRYLLLHRYPSVHIQWNYFSSSRSLRKPQCWNIFCNKIEYAALLDLAFSLEDYNSWCS